MKQPMVVTNLRIPEVNYLQVKMAAGELGMSVNEYINDLIKDTTRARMMKAKTSKQKPKKETIHEAFKRISKMPDKPMGWSEEDEAIYSI